DKPDKLLDSGSDADGFEFNQRFKKLRGTIYLHVRSQGQTENTALKKIELPLDGFHPGDTVVGTTDVANNTPYSPFRLAPLPESQQRAAGFLEFNERMQKLAGRLAVIQVRRHGSPADAQPVSILVPPAYHRTLGLRMRMGKVVAIREVE